MSSQSSPTFRLWHRATRALCALGIFTLVGIRALYFGFENPPPELGAALGRLLNSDLRWSFVLGLGGVFLAAFLGLALLAMLLLRPRLVATREEGRWAAAPWLHVAAWLLLLCETWTLDLNPDVALVGALSIALWASVRALPATRWGPVRPRMRNALWALFFAGALWTAKDAADAVGIAVWGLVLLALGGLSRRVALRDRAWATLGALGAVQLGVAALPLVAPAHGGNLLAPGMAYSFCESSERHRLYAAVPECRSELTGKRLETCRNGHVDVYDTRDLTRRRELRLFDESFYGRMEQIACIGDTVEIGMEHTMLDGTMRAEHVVSFPMDAPESVDRDPLHGRGGARIVHDEASDALFYVTAFSNGFFRLDRVSGLMEAVLEDAGFDRGSTSATLHRSRESLLVLGTGTDPVREFDLRTLEPIAEYPQATGVEITVDEELGRLFVSSFFGLEVFDLATGERLARRRLGFVARQVAISTQHDLVFVPTFFEGKLRVFDRRTLEPLGKIPIGMYVRYPLVSSDGTKLFASSLRAYYYWELSSLAERFGRP